jgi:hypothetical protein
MTPMTLEQATAARGEAIEGNRELAVAEYKSGEKQADVVYEVIEGYKHLPGGIRLGPGQRFRPTERQIANGSLKGKARELTRSEYGSVGRSERRAVAHGADIGIRALPMAEGTLKFALEAGLRETDFDGVEPGFEGRYTKAQVAEIIEARSRDLLAQRGPADA